VEWDGGRDVSMVRGIEVFGGQSLGFFRISFLDLPPLLIGFFLLFLAPLPIVPGQATSAW
jgi:hypothetical protein